MPSLSIVNLHEQLQFCFCVALVLNYYLFADVSFVVFCCRLCFFVEMLLMGGCYEAVITLRGLDF